MNNPFRAPEDYELYLYSLKENFPSIISSSVTFIRLGSSLARVTGELIFAKNIRLVLRERVIFDRLPLILDWYGYEIYQGEEKLFWYDSQPQPNEKTLQSTYPHHKHIPPDIKHNRIPAPDMSFIRPNLPALITEIGSL